MTIVLTPMCGLRVFLQILLMGLFLVYFGLPAVKEYLKQEVMVVETKKDTSGLPAPAITVTVMPSDRSQKAACFHSSSSVEDCIKANTFNRSQILHDVVLGFTKRESVGGKEEFYTEDYTASLTGFWFLMVLGCFWLFVVLYRGLPCLAHRPPIFFQLSPENCHKWKR